MGGGGGGRGTLTRIGRSSMCIKWVSNDQSLQWRESEGGGGGGERERDRQTDRQTDGINVLFIY